MKLQKTKFEKEDFQNNEIEKAEFQNNKLKKAKLKKKEIEKTDFQNNKLDKTEFQKDKPEKIEFKNGNLQKIATQNIKSQKIKLRKKLLISIIIFLLFFTTSFASTNIGENANNQPNNSKIQLDYYFQNRKLNILNNESSKKNDHNFTKNISTSEITSLDSSQIHNSDSNTNSITSSNADNNTSNTTQKLTTPLELNAESCILIETSTNRVAYEKNSEEKVYPASTTKLLTAIITLDHCNLQDTVIITKDMVSNIPSGYTSAYLKPGEKLTIEQLLNSLLIPSANDAGFALAIHISGSIEEFAKLMNEKATEIGCTNSNFTNPSGIHDENHYSTAKDMGIIGLYALRYPQITDIVCKTSYVLQPENSYSRKFETTNTLIKSNEKNYYKYATGMKTGFTEPAGACLIASAKKDDMQFLAVILNAPSADNTANYRDLDAINLFEYGFTNYQEIVKEEEKPQTIFNLSNGNFITEQNIYAILIIASILFVLYLIIAITKSKSKK